MRELAVLAPLWLLAVLWQMRMSGLPGCLHADLGLLMGLCGMAFLRREVGLFFLFALGLQADLLGSGRLGLLTVGYLLSGGLLLGIEQELASNGWRPVALAALAGSVITHGFYFVISNFSSVGAGWIWGAGTWLNLTIAAAVWVWPVAWLLQKVWTWTRLLSPEAQAARMQQKDAGRGKLRARRAVSTSAFPG